MIKFSSTELKRLLKIAEEAAYRAGRFLIQIKKINQLVKVDTRRDVKITADAESEKIIIDFLKRETFFSILAEESNKKENKIGNGLTWIVDPLDGSLNFLRGIPVSCVSIGLWNDRKPLIGVVYDFNKRELFSGIVNKTASLNGLKIKVSSVSKKEKAVLCTGFPVNTDFSKDGIKRFIGHVRAYKKVRLLGSAALSLAYVASGRADAYYEKDIMIWDVAAGLALIIAAGGNISIRPSTKENAFIIYASNKYLSKRI